MRLLLIQKLKTEANRVNWMLLVFLLLVLNVKLPVKVLAVIIFGFIYRKRISIKALFRQRYLYFYLGLVFIGLVNLLLNYKTIDTAYLATTAVGLSFWMMCAVIANHLYTVVQKEDAEKIHHTIALFFILHFSAIYFNLLQIIIETGSINPYRYKGLNQKYYISTGDFITGITFDSPVTTAFICTFGLLYFLYRKQYLLSLAAMAALLIMASNFANLILAGVFIFAFLFYSNRVQKSFIILYGVMLVVFMGKVSPQNNEHVGRILYQVIDKPYDLPPVIEMPVDQLKKEPDSVLNHEQRRKKYAQNYIDSLSTIKSGMVNILPHVDSVEAIFPDTVKIINEDTFYQFHESPFVENKINRYTIFLNHMYPAKIQDSLNKLYNWKLPGKWIAATQLLSFFKNNPALILLGNGTGNYASRIAFKATCLNIAGRYPEQFKYVNPDFLYNQLFIFLYYHSKQQSLHAATNTPDAVYYQIAGEYGLAGLLLLFVFYFGYFIRNIRRVSYGLPLIFMLAGAFFAEFWFEQFSIVILFELLLLLNLKEMHPGEQQS